MLNKFINEFKKNREIYLRIKAKPNASKNEVKEVMADETIKIAVAAPPVKGKANQQLIEFLAAQFNVDKNNIKILSGAHEQLKFIKINL